MVSRLDGVVFDGATHGLTGGYWGRAQSQVKVDTAMAITFSIFFFALGIILLTAELPWVMALTLF